MSLLRAALRTRSERAEGSWFVVDEVGALAMVDEARAEGLLSPGDVPQRPDVVARVDGTPLVVRCRMPVKTVYVYRPEKIPSPTREDAVLAERVARSINLV